MSDDPCHFSFEGLRGHLEIMAIAGFPQSGRLSAVAPGARKESAYRLDDAGLGGLDARFRPDGPCRFGQFHVKHSMQDCCKFRKEREGKTAR